MIGNTREEPTMSNFKIAFIVLGGMAVTGFMGATASHAEAGSIVSNGAPAARQPIVRDHRTPKPVVSKGAPAAREPQVRDHREPKPVASNGAPAPREQTVRDHRAPRVRDHRN
jgi:hypothetical protein